MKVKWLEVTNVKSFKQKTRVVLNDDYNFVVGTNGSGKTTLLQLLSACILTLVPPIKTETQAEGQTRKMRFNNTRNAINLPKNYDLETDPQKVTIHVSLEESKDGLIEELEAYQEIFLENKDYILSRYFSQESLFDNTAEFLRQFKAYASYDFSIDFEIIPFENGNTISITGDSRSANTGLIDLLESLETQRILYDQIIRSGKTERIVSRGFHIIYLGADRQPSFPNELSLNKGNIDEYLNNSAYSRKADLMSSVFASSSFDYINQTLTRITEKYVYNRWNKRQLKPLDDIKEYTELKKSLAELLDIDFVVSEPGLPYENMEFSFISGGKRIYYEQLSSGEKSLIYFLFTMVNPDIRNSFIIIDEAEIHLHGNMQDTLLEIIYGKSEFKNQHFISTHSPKMINRLTISAVLRFYKVNKESCYINFKTETNLGSDYDVIRLINSQNNEKVFFADKVVLVEGIKDRIFIEHLLDILKDSKEIIEVIDVGGKLNLSFYKKYLDEIKVKNYTLADFDYLYDIRKKELSGLLATNTTKIDRLLKDKKSADRISMIEAIDNFTASNDKTSLASMSAYMKSRGIKLKDGLTKQELEVLHKVINDLETQQIFVISSGITSKPDEFSGEIEDYMRHFKSSKNGGDAINNLVNAISKDNYIKDLLAKNDPSLINELLKFLATVLSDDEAKAGHYLNTLKKL